MVRKTTGNIGRCSWTRRSHHLKAPQRLRPVRTVVTRSQRTSGGCFFNGLPAEVFHMILDEMSVVDISVFSMVSKEITSYIVDYVSSQAWRNKTIIQSFHNPTLLEQRSTLEHYRHLGLLFKRCTLLLPTKDRLKFTFSKFSEIPCFMLERCLAPDCTGYSRYGVFLQTLIAGWDELECHRVFNFLCDQTGLLLKTEALLTAKPGLKRNQELQLRLFCRKVLLDPCQNQPDGQFWLVQLLKPWPMVSQAHLLFILYGPLLHEGVLGWQDLVERGIPHSALWDLAKGLLMLFGTLQVKGWSTDSVISILEELIVIPQPWFVENVARLLVLCGSSLCYTFLASKALNGRISEISRIIIHIILVCEKEGYHMSWAVKLVQQICSLFSTAPERFVFIQHLENMFSEVTREFFESSVAGNNFEDRETFQTLCILLDSSARFHTKLLHMFLK
ncbi:F-box only protein 47 isoform X1 [Fundulus heteroclitus]|uniref:F-box only protein 47 isoform X1 n=1 Tax=Fundulus heteroclitus TaxID=8078 RepID=UPI00165B244D|nr:F-box only protein 47 isoform X1 [Fundulus heteroclitus]XP_035995411.1 F-box only protein 47 isoform X1 [Fundulus heteroclitus]XP_035995412.1 F-box only protein 47 isoform X1 [Fundulus heteroclitus]